MVLLGLGHGRAVINDDYHVVRPGRDVGGTCTVSVPSAVIVAVVSIVRMERSPNKGVEAGIRQGRVSPAAEHAPGWHTRDHAPVTL
jgi:hypothetical protein